MSESHPKIVNVRFTAAQHASLRYLSGIAAIPVAVLIRRAAIEFLARSNTSGMSPIPVAHSSQPASNTSAEHISGTTGIAAIPVTHVTPIEPNFMGGDPPDDMSNEDFAEAPHGA